MPRKFRYSDLYSYFCLLALFGATSALAGAPLHAQTTSRSVPTDSAPTAAPTAPAVARYVPHRVFDSRSGDMTDFEAMVVTLASADVVFLGEQHDDFGTHRLQAAVLEGIARRRQGPVVVALEMFERDAQPALDAWMRGASTEAAFLEHSRPWPNYAADYRPLIEVARAENWPVVAGNVPRRFAQLVGRKGLRSLDSLPPGDRALIADELVCPRDEYWRRFAETMGDMSGHGMQVTPAEADAMKWRFYEAQCVKDETMAEAVARAYREHETLVVHVNGAFHSDRGLGTAERVRRRLPDARVVVVTFVPRADLDTVDAAAHRAMGDFIVFTLDQD